MPTLGEAYLLGELVNSRKELVKEVKLDPECPLRTF